MVGGQELTRGEGRTKVTFMVHYLGDDIIVRIYNQNAHIGAVAVAEFDTDSGRTSTSIITRRGHKDDVVAQKVAYLITKNTKRPSCVIAGIHIDEITEAEIEQIVANVDNLSDEYIAQRHRRKR